MLKSNMASGQFTGKSEMTNNLCQLARDWAGTMSHDGLLCEEKIDGFRALRFPGIDGVTRLWTRNGLPIEGTGHILHQLARLEREAGETLFFDGEFQVAGTLDATKRWCESGWKLGDEAGIYHLFDAMPLTQWRAGGDPTPLYQRKARLKALVEAVDTAPQWEWREGSHGRDENGPIPVLLVEDEWCFSAPDVIDAATRVWAAGGEGCMAKLADAPYERRRSKAWLKVKPGGPWLKALT